MGWFDELKKAMRDAEAEKKALATKYIPRQNNWCKDADRFIKEMDVKIAQMAKDKISKSTAKKVYAGIVMPSLEKKRSDLQIEFINKECTHKLELEKAKETAGIIGNEAEKYEADVLSGSDKERKQLFIIGGVVILGALGIILYSMKKK